MLSLTIPPRGWRDGFPGLAKGEHRGWAYLRCRQDGVNRTVVAGQPITALPPGRKAHHFGPLDDLLVLELTESIAGKSADDLLNDFQPGPKQFVLALTLGFGSAAGRWSGTASIYSRREPLDEFELVGAGMRRITRAPAPTLPELAASIERLDPHGRWSRTRGALGDDVWSSVRTSRVAIIGASRNGSAAAFAFAMLGVSELLLIDPDRDEWHNLDATLGAAPVELGDFKVFNRRAALRALRPDDLTVQALPVALPHPEAEQRMQQANLICTTVDRDAARVVASRVANRWGRVHLDLGSGVFDEGGNRVQGGDMRLLLPGEACVICLGLRDPDLALREANAPPGSLRRGRRVAWNEQRGGSLVTVNSATVHLGIQMWLDLLAGRITSSRWQRLEWDAAGEPRITTMPSDGAGCLFCRGPRDKPNRAA